ncbi:MAG: polysaccharide deacetylase family protein [Bacteroidales bacterium]|nr:polysaccharide deacetylase family protein [Bacteroidales bacterium]
MINLSPPRFLTRLFPSLIWSFPDEPDGVFLTFDDGPTQEITLWVLDQLKRYDAKATFFMLGKNIELNPEIYERVVAEGHTIGNHSYSHLKGWATETGQYVQDVDFANGFVHSKLYRPPYGRIKPSQFRILRDRYKIIMWDVLSMDYSRRVSPRRVTNNVVNHLHPGAIIVFHDSKKAERNLRYALPRVLEAISQKGLKFKRIEQDSFSFKG